MKLEYIWVEKYNQFKNIEFNFSSSNRFTYEIDESSKILKHVISNNRYKDFFNKYDDKSGNKIMDIIAITGSNGVGKSTLLKMIPELLSYIDRDVCSPEFIIVISDNKNNFEICSNIYDLIIPSKLKGINFNYKHTSLGEEDKISEKINVLYYSNDFDINSIIDDDISEADNVLDISTMRMIENHRLGIYNGSEQKTSEIKSYFYLEFNRQIDFILECHNSLKHIKDRFPKKIIISIKELDKRIDRLISIVELGYSRKDSQNLSDDNYDIRELLYEQINYLKHMFNSIMDDFYITEKEYFITCLIYICTIEVLEEKIDINHINQLRYEYEVDTIDMIQKLANSSSYDELIYKFIQVEESIGIFMDTEHIIKLIDNDNNDILTPLEFTGIDKIIAYDIDKIEYKNKTNMVKEFYENFCKRGLLNGMLDVSWPLSSGENNLLKMYSRIYYCWKNYLYRAHSKNILLLIDEAEISYHPRWQQEYIKSIIDLIYDIFEESNIQIIFTTHSPIVLSDIPHNNIIYLHNNKKLNQDYSSITTNELTKTFGANIYNLYNNSFYLNESPVTGIIGSYANDKINRVIKDFEEIIEYCNILKNKKTKIDLSQEKLYEQKISHAETIIDIIGDQLIKDILRERFIETKQIFNSVKSKSSKIQELYDKLTNSEKRELIDLILRSNI